MAIGAEKKVQRGEAPLRLGWEPWVRAMLLSLLPPDIWGHREAMSHGRQSEPVPELP